MNTMKHVPDGRSIDERKRAGSIATMEQWKLEGKHAENIVTTPEPDTQDAHQKVENLIDLE